MNLSKIKRLIILNKTIKGDLSKCNICNVNFTAIQPCIICQSIIEKEKKVGRKLTSEEFRKLIKGIL